MAELQTQSKVFENIKSLCTNYKKDGAERKKKAGYLTKRLLSLENQWKDFAERHAILMKSEDKNSAYFKENVYERTQEMYENTKSNILLLMSENIQDDECDHYPAVSDDQQKLEKNDPVNTKIRELLTRQEGNCKAIDRAMSKINIEDPMEKWEIEDHLSILRTKWEAADKLHWELDGLLQGSEEKYYTLFATIEEEYDQLKKTLRT